MIKVVDGTEFLFSSTATSSPGLILEESIGGSILRPAPEIPPHLLPYALDIQGEILPFLAPTETAGLYRTPGSHVLLPGLPLFLILTGPSGSGKDFVLTPIKEADRLRCLDDRDIAVTGASRLIRPGEPEDTYVWLPEFDPKVMTFEEYLAALPRELKLIEHDIHHGKVYGLPLISALRAINRGFGIIRTEYNALETLFEALHHSSTSPNRIARANIITAMVIPGCFKDVICSVKGRGEEDDRIKHGYITLRKVFDIADFVFHNSRKPHLHPTGEIYEPETAQRRFCSFVNHVKQVAFSLFNSGDNIPVII